MVFSSSMHSHTKNHDAGISNSNPHIGSSQRPTMGISNSSVNKPLPITQQSTGNFPVEDLGDTQVKFELFQSKLFAMVQAM